MGNVDEVPQLTQITDGTKDNQYESDDNEHGYSHFTRGDIKQIKRYAEEILQHERSTIQVKSDGTVIITPHPRQLPNEILARIIHHVDEATLPHYIITEGRQPDQQRDLHTCTLVNRQFYAIANPLLWQEPVFDVDTMHLQQWLDGLAATEQSLGNHVKKLQLDNATCTDIQLLLLMTHVRHLETLSIENLNFTNEFSPITSTGLQHLPRYCSQLTSLKLFNIHLSDATIRAIGQHCRRLCQLTVHANVGLSDDLLAALANCPLQQIALSYDATEGMLTEKMVMDMTRFQDLTHLDLTLFEPSSLIMTIANNKITTGVPWPHLKYLSLDLCEDIDDATLICFIKAHPHLQEIRLKDAIALTDASLAAMAVSLCDLRGCIFTRMNGISSRGARQWIQNCQRLERVQFRQCDQIKATDILETLDDDNSDYLRLDEHDIVKIRSA
ncbi:hypothetical protein BCR42DRAFT_429734 [Absidia repens]|uniref:Uncharacterized protein n=1 Tax=Absidia repens TaxID=90262 RepID=A0A1X2HR29_9FUNG|nr:hypothetical protein BCR42DRAFT_429734 [Absidia repens]